MLVYCEWRRREFLEGDNGGVKSKESLMFFRESVVK